MQAKGFRDSSRKPKEASNDGQCFGKQKIAVDRDNNRPRTANREEIYNVNQENHNQGWAKFYSIKQQISANSTNQIGCTGQEKFSERLETYTVYVSSYWGILPAHLIHEYWLETATNFEISRRLKDEYGEVIPCIAELVEEAAEFFRKHNWTARHCLYCGIFFGPDKSDERRHLFGVKDGPTWTYPACPGRLNQGEYPWDPVRKSPATKLVKIDVDTRRGIHRIE